MTLSDMSKCLPIWNHLSSEFWENFFELAKAEPNWKEVVFSQIEKYRLTFWGEFVDNKVTKSSENCDFTMLISDRKIISIRVDTGAKSYEIR